MRVKTVPRHLPRKDSTQGFTREKDTTKKLDVRGPVCVKTVNFTTYEDIVEEINSVEIKVRACKPFFIICLFHKLLTQCSYCFLIL